MYRQSKVPRKLSTDLADTRRALFDGPTLIQVAPPKDKNIFSMIRRSVKLGYPDYARYLECKAFTKTQYEHFFEAESYVSNMKIVEPHDKQSVILFSTDKYDRVNGTLRICKDSELGLPMGKDVPRVISDLRRRGLFIGEPGRFCQSTGARTYRRMVSAAFAIASYAGMYAYLMQCRLDQQTFYENQVAAEALPIPAPEGCVNMIWRIANTPEKFIHRFGHTQEQLEALLR